MEYPSWLDVELWEEYKLHRVQMRKKLTDVAEKRAIKKLATLCKESNCTQEDIIEQTLENGWLGLFHLKVQHNARTRTVSGQCAASAEARRLQAEGFRTGFEDEESDRTALPPNVVNLR